MTEAGQPDVAPEQTAVVATGAGVGVAIATRAAERVEFPRLLLALLIVFAAALAVALHAQSFFDDPKLDGLLISAGLRAEIRTLLPAGLPLERILPPIAMAAVTAWLVGAAAIALCTWSAWRTALWNWGVRFLWLSPLALFETLRALFHASGSVASVDGLAMLLACLPFIHTITWGGLLAGWVGLVVPVRVESDGVRARWLFGIVCVGAVIYAVVFSVLSIAQYESLMVPHGDTAMYEEHLWNVLHGKGFRSQLDDGRLFFGEHLEVIHLFLLPIYIFYPCLPTLNVCHSLGLASGGLAVFGFTRRITGSASAAAWLALAYWLYFPLQYLNLEVSLKTFRPENFGVPLLLFAMWCLEARRYRTMLGLLGLTLLCKEDYALPVGMVGLYLAVRWRDDSVTRPSRLLGLGIVVFSVVYLWFVLDVFIPYFRGGPPHYMAYYPELGRSPSEVVSNLVRQPLLLAKPLVELGNLVFVLMLFVPLAMSPAAGVSRLWLLLPSLGAILWIRLPDARSPFFHFHAPLVPVLFWAAAEGLARAGSDWWQWPARLAARLRGGWPGEPASAATDRARGGTAPARPGIARAIRWARLAAGCALVSGFFSGKSPLSIGFYDPHMEARAYGRALYAPVGIARERVRAFDKVFELIPRDASVAASDYIRPRFTHHRECHQYGEGGLKGHVDPDTIDYIVIDLLGPFSNVWSGTRLREREQHPDRWEVVHWDPFGEMFFLVVRRSSGELMEREVQP